MVRETGKFLIQHVVEQVARAKRISEAIVATDDPRIHDAVQSFGGRSMMTRADHPSGTDRVAEVAHQIDADLILNVQGDEPELEPGYIDQLVERMTADPEVSVGTLACPFSRDSDPRDPNVVKVVINSRGRALYFSRSLIPYPRDAAGTPADPTDWLLHIGIYAYRRDFLFELAAMPPSRLEMMEKLEQLRVLDSGHSIAVTQVERAFPGIDTPQDYAEFVARCAGRRLPR